MPEKLVRHLQLCDLVSFDMDFACPQEFQRENVFYTANRFEKTGNLNLKAHNLAQLTDTREGLLGNLRKSLDAGRGGRSRSFHRFDPDTAIGHALL